MLNNLYDWRRINILVDESRNIAIFPISQSNFPFKNVHGDVSKSVYLPAYYPIELKYPYNNQELADKIQFGIEQWNLHECHNRQKAKMTFEEKYYGVKGFKYAIKGKILLILGWDFIQGKYISLHYPCKRGYAYLGLKEIKLSDEADWIDFANGVIELINIDLTQLNSYKSLKSELNI